MDRDRDVIFVFRADGSIKAGWDATPDQLRAVRDTLIQILLGQTTVKEKPDDFTTYTFPPKE